MSKFRFEPEKCPLCNSHNIRKVVLQYFDFDGIQTEEKKMCRDCHATFDKHMNVETISYNQEIVNA